MPFEEISHTADWSLRAWAEDLTLLFADTARGMNALAGVRLSEKQRIQRTISVSADDSESLLVSFLSELVFFAEHDQLAFDDFEVSISKGIDQACLLTASIHGAPILSSDKVIKAVTYHGLQIQKTARGLEVEIVFDV